MKIFINREGSLYYLVLLCMVLMTGCFKDHKEDFMFRETQIEFDATSFESMAPGKTYPILGPLEKGTGIKTYKVNLLGEQKSTAQTLQVRAVADESTARANVHYRLPGNGTFTIPANSNTGQVEVEILDFPSETGNALLVLELVGNEEVKVSENYKRLGISISLVGPPSTAFPLYPQLGSQSFFNTMVVDLAQPGLSADFLSRWNAMKANLWAFSTGGRTPYNLQIRIGDDKLVRVMLVYTTGTVAFSYAYATWVYKFEPNAQGVGKFVFVEAADVNATNLLNAGVTDPILKNWLQAYDFKVDWVPTSIVTPRAGTYIGGLFRADNTASFLFGELNYIAFTSNTPRPLFAPPAFTSIFANNNTFYTSVLIDPADAGQSQDFKNRWAAGKAAIQALAGRQLNQMMLKIDPTFYDVVVVMAYANATNTSKLLGQTKYWMNVAPNGDLKFDYVFRDANAAVTSPSQLFSDYLDLRKFKVTRSGTKLTFTRTDDASSYFVGTLGDLGIATTSFTWSF